MPKNILIVGWLMAFAVALGTLHAQIELDYSSRARNALLLPMDLKWDQTTKQFSIAGYGYTLNSNRIYDADVFQEYTLYWNWIEYFDENGRLCCSQQRPYSFPIWGQPARAYFQVCLPPPNSSINQQDFLLGSTHSFFLSGYNELIGRGAYNRAIHLPTLDWRIDSYDRNNPISSEITRRLQGQRWHWRDPSPQSYALSGVVDDKLTFRFYTLGHTWAQRGNDLTCATKTSSLPSRDLIVQAFDLQMNPQWQVCLGSADDDSTSLRGLTQLPNGNLLAGATAYGSKLGTRETLTS